MITDYKEIKESVLGCYEKMIETAHQIGFSTEDTSYISAKNQAEKIKDDRFCLMIAGEAKSGSRRTKEKTGGILQTRLMGGML